MRECNVALPLAFLSAFPVSPKDEEEDDDDEEDVDEDISNEMISQLKAGILNTLKSGNFDKGGEITNVTCKVLGVNFASGFVYPGHKTQAGNLRAVSR